MNEIRFYTDKWLVVCEHISLKAVIVKDEYPEYLEVLLIRCEICKRDYQYEVCVN